VSLLERLEKAPPEQAIQEAEEAQRNFFRESLFLTGKCLLGYNEMTWGTHGPICDALANPRTTRKLVVVPRGCFKSSIGSVTFPIWHIIRNPNVRILLDSELYTNSKNFLREIKDHLINPRLERLFGTFKSSTWNEGEIIVGQRTKVHKEATITCTGIGAEKTGQHYDIIVMDDMNSPSNSNTPEGCQKVINHYRHMQAILEPNGIIVIIGTRYSAADLIQSVIDNEVFLSKDS
jgi:hypothetical protein